MDDTLDAFAGCKLFSTLDLATGYWQIAMNADDQHKTAFTTPLGLYEFTVLPMGCCNGPATFQRLMQHILDNLLTLSDPVCRVFFDDIGLGSSTIAQGLAGLTSLFSRLRQYHLKLRLSKCAFLQSRTTFLGVDLSAEGVHTSASKVKDIATWSTPENVRGVRAFLGLAGYYRRFVPKFAQISAPLTALTRKGVPFHWNSACAAAFRMLKDRLSTAPVLNLPDYSASAAPFVLDVDASSCGMGGVLSQQQDGMEQALLCGNAVLSKAQQNYSAIERELLALVHFAHAFRYYLVGQEFIAHTDHVALKGLYNIKENQGHLRSLA